MNGLSNGISNKSDSHHKHKHKDKDKDRHHDKHKHKDKDKDKERERHSSKVMPSLFILLYSVFHVHVSSFIYICVRLCVIVGKE